MNESCQKSGGAATSDSGDRAGEVLDRLASEYGVASWCPSGLPVDDLVATILSQNTSDTNTERAFSALRARFPTWKAVRDAPTGEVADSIRPGGLADVKAPRIQHVLSEILTDDESDPNERYLAELRDLGRKRAMERLTALPGVGPKTAACVLLFAVGLPALPVDTHVFRVAKRLGLIEPNVEANNAHELLRRQVGPGRAYQFHVHVIKHGRTVCRARNPRCDACILQELCCYHAGQVESI